MGEDALLPWFGGGPALLVAQADGVQTPPSGASPALYCDGVRHHRTDGLFR